MYSLLKSAVAVCLLILISSLNVQAQAGHNRDSRIASMISEISSLNLRNNVAKLAGFGTRHTFSGNAKNERGIEAACRWVKNEFEKIASGSKSKFEVVWDTFTVNPDGRRIKNRAQLFNVLGRLKGNNPDDKRVFIISAHIDSRNGNANDTEGDAPGANDDASGVALILELARVMAGREFPADILFAVLTGEEQGLLGATHLAKTAMENGCIIGAMLNNDMVGNTLSSGVNLSDNLRVRIFSEGIPAFETDEMKAVRQAVSGENDSRSRQLARYVKETGERYVDNLEVKLIYRNDRFLRGGDHTPFLKAGFTAVRITEMNENFDRQHQNIREEKGVKYGDLPEYVDYEYVRKIGAMNLAVIANAAYAPLPPEKVIIETREVTNETNLKWIPPAGDKPAGYYVLIRETTSPVWEKKIFVEGTGINIPYSKDNYFFAVQSCGARGNESIPVFPSIQR